MTQEQVVDICKKFSELAIECKLGNLSTGSVVLKVDEDAWRDFIESLLQWYGNVLRWECPEGFGTNSFMGFKIEMVRRDYAVKIWEFI